MQEIYLVFVVLLFALAIFDLVVGVSNDAVNFLNSAIGAKVASWRTIMIIASLGVFIGATFSSGMMEVARKSIFHPENFSFLEIMAIFLAVMLADIILLDTFNSLGLPTSTTVSIVFELLGAAVAVSLIKMTGSDEGLGHINEYINGTKALEIIGGILFSVVAAFGIGALVQYLSRLLFTFQYEKRMKYVGAIWGAIALAAMSYFLIIKGLKNASFIEKDQIKWVMEHTLLVVSIVFVAWAVIMQVLISFTKIKVLKLVVLFGTFALAMAFAGNDLVNFIGVPIAGFEAYGAWAASGVAPDQYMMTALSEPVQTDTYLLLIAGGIMVATLWFSKKARSVTETTVKLSRQSDGAERFHPNRFSRALVRIARSLSQGIAAVVPVETMKRIDRNFATPAAKTADDGMAFDLIRASVNLFVASIVISIATSMKLPLSTTYVTFMVAMGAALSDRAWGRDSAVYRVAGMVSVIGGWFATAAVAFLIAAFFATLIYHFGIYAVVGLTCLAAFLIIRSTLRHRKLSAENAKYEAAESDFDGSTIAIIQQNTVSKVATSIKAIKAILHDTYAGLVDEDLAPLRQVKVEVHDLRRINEQFRYGLFHYLKEIKEDQPKAGRLYLKVFDYEEDLVAHSHQLSNVCLDHVRNMHSPLAQAQIDYLRELDGIIAAFLEKIVSTLDSGVFDENAWSSVKKDLKAILALIDDIEDAQNAGIRNSVYGSRNSLLLFSVLNKTRDITSGAASFVKLYYKLQQAVGDQFDSEELVD